MGKSIKKTIAKFDIGHQLVKKMGLPDPVGDALYGSDKALSPAEQAEKDARGQANQAGSMEAAPTAVSDDTLAAREAQRKRQLAAAGLSGTNLTGGSLGAVASTSNKTLLGS